MPKTGTRQKCGSGTGLKFSDRDMDPVSNRVLMSKDDAHCISLGNISSNGANQKMTEIFAGTEE